MFAFASDGDHAGLPTIWPPLRVKTVADASSPRELMQSIAPEGNGDDVLRSDWVRLPIVVVWTGQ
jgi:hypothetical protein